MTPTDPTAEIARLRRLQRRWMWLAIAGVALTVFGYLCSLLCKQPPPARTASVSPLATPYPSPQEPTPASPSPAAPAPSKPTPSASQSPPPFDLNAPFVTGDTFSFLLVQQRFAAACPDIEVFPLPRSITTEVHLRAVSCSVATSAKVYAPGPVAGWSTMVAYVTMARDDAGTGTIVRSDWSCGMRLRPRADSSALAGVFLPYDIKETFSMDEYSRHRISLRDVVNLCSSVRP